jgi:hypothetical protein
MKTIKKQIAYLTVFFPNEGDIKDPAHQLKYNTTNFEEVFKFKKICDFNKIPYTVRFREVEVFDDSHIRNKHKLFNNVKSFFNRRVF